MDHSPGECGPIYIKAPYPLSDTMPEAYAAAIDKTINEVL